MPNICHLFDGTAGWDQRLAVSQLLERLPADRCAQALASIGPSHHALGPLRPHVRIIPRIAGLNPLAAPLLARMAERSRIDVFHAWGVDAAAAARAAGERPVVVELFDPAQAARSARLMRAISRPQGMALICSSGTVRRRLIENGVAPEQCVVIRPGIDFSLIQKTRRSDLRARLGVPPEEVAVLLTEPTRIGGSHFDAFWSVAALNAVEGCYKAILPGISREHERIARLAHGLPSRPTLIVPPGKTAFEELIAVSDVLLIADAGDIPTTAIAWAMGANVAVIAAAGYAVTELIVSRVNGLLYKAPARKTHAMEIARLLRDAEGQRKAREAARGQAYEVFSLRRFIEQHDRVYENVLSGKPASEGITDPAQVG